ncbi:DUF1149 family protein [Listeria sp. PSOL-1]|uniref:DUF1149 family protein n=1 Tax=Listeria sp. PSOL-1 TaxID=1844999 RepID=UPI0013D7A938|nr:DUF1149 family protein [Listeria sp. PSOL-1]
MEIKTNQIIVEKYNFETILAKQEQVENTVRVEINEVEPTSDDKSILEEGKLFKIDVPFDLILPQFKINGQISRIVQLVDFFGQGNELGEELIQELSKPLISYITRLTYEVSEIAFDAPGIDLDFTANNNE